MDRNYINTRQLRAERLANLKALQDQAAAAGAAALPLIPDGAAAAGQAPGGMPPLLLPPRPQPGPGSDSDGASTPMASDAEPAAPSGAEETLHYPRSCYVCKKRCVRSHMLSCTGCRTRD
jgi:hypothetical protein